MTSEVTYLRGAGYAAEFPESRKSTVVADIVPAQDDTVSGGPGGIVGSDEPLIPKHGGYRKLKSFQLEQLI
jgi:hypothetical protein